jgi:hypothetical protein
MKRNEEKCSSKTFLLDSKMRGRLRAGLLLVRRHRRIKHNLLAQKRVESENEMSKYVKMNLTKIYYQYVRLVVLKLQVLRKI